MNIFLDTISPKNALILFDEKRNILEKYFFDVRLNESTLLIEEFDAFLKKNNVTYTDLENIVVVNGPGSFTGVRTTVLMVNTINFVMKKNITTLTYFDLFENYPIIKTSSKRDGFVKMAKESEIEVIQNEDLVKKLENIQTIYGDIHLENFEVITEVNYEKIIQNIVFQNQKIVPAYYLKKPNIS
ncbi:MAG: hypothetical protein AB7E37_02115 [Candidatus Altimarinota bacterium]